MKCLGYVSKDSDPGIRLSREGQHLRVLALFVVSGAVRPARRMRPYGTPQVGPHNPGHSAAHLSANAISLEMILGRYKPTTTSQPTPLKRQTNTTSPTADENCEHHLPRPSTQQQPTATRARGNTH